MPTGKFQINSLPKNERIRLIGEVYTALGVVKGRDEARLVFADLFTVSELAMIGRRIRIAAMLLSGYTLEQVVSTLRVGKATVLSVKKQIDKDRDGYRLIIHRLKKERTTRKIYKKQRTKLSQVRSLPLAAFLEAIGVSE